MSGQRRLMMTLKGTKLSMTDINTERLLAALLTLEGEMAILDLSIETIVSALVDAFPEWAIEARLRHKGVWGRSGDHPFHCRMCGGYMPDAHTFATHLHEWHGRPDTKAHQESICEWLKRATEAAQLRQMKGHEGFRWQSQ